MHRSQPLSAPATLSTPPTPRGATSSQWAARFTLRSALPRRRRTTATSISRLSPAPAAPATMRATTLMEGSTTRQTRPTRYASSFPTAATRRANSTSPTTTTMLTRLKKPTRALASPSSHKPTAISGSRSSSRAIKPQTPAPWSSMPTFRTSPHVSMPVVIMTILGVTRTSLSAWPSVMPPSPLSSLSTVSRWPTVPMATATPCISPCLSKRL